jgi:hypothetical protein
MWQAFRNHVVHVWDIALKAGPWPFLVLGVLDRWILIARFGARYVSTDDAILWAGTVDLAQGILRWPYYYGQDYGPMFEALIAAPFTAFGLPLDRLLPTISSALTLLPFWSFALFHHVHGRPRAALTFALMPLLLPVEFGMMTTMPRGFVTGLAALAVLPWLFRSRDTIPGALLTGAAVSFAWYLNPNSLVFSLPYLLWLIGMTKPGIRTCSALLAGTLPAIALHITSQAWCASRPGAIVHRLGYSGWHFDGAATWHGLGRLDEHFQWLCPVFWGYEGVLAPGLVALSILAFRRGDRILSAVIPVALAGIVASLSLPKVHDGWDSVFFPLSRMFLAIPLLVAWALSLSAPPVAAHRTHVLLALLASVTAIAYKAAHVDRVGADQVAAQSKWVSVRPFAELKEDAAALKTLCEAHDVDLIVVPIRLGTRIWAQFRAYLHPTLVPDLPPTYLYGYERRHWQRTEQGQAIHPTILVIGGAEERWAELRARDPRILRLGDLQGDRVHVFTGNDRPTDRLMASMLEDLLGAGP